MRLYKDKLSEQLGEGEKIKGYSPDLTAKARRKIEMVKAAAHLDDLRIPPSNHLEKLLGDRAGQYSIRIDGRYRICFEWIEGKATDIEFVDYH